VSGFRTEHDALGAVDVPSDALFGAHTARAVANFASPPVRLADRPELIRALAHVKASAAEANAELGVLDATVAGAIVAAADELVAGQWHEQFPLALVQGGGGTSTNMAVNEVLANRAAQLLGGQPGDYEIVHPLDHVNRSQSTNDVLPTALQLAALELLEPTTAALAAVALALEDCATSAGALIRLGRTCLQDALPLPVSSYHNAQAHAVRRGAADIERAGQVLLAIPLGATAVGTGLGAPPTYREIAVSHLARRTGLPLLPADDLFDALAHLDPLYALASAAGEAAISLAKISADLRFLSSGPIGGVGEVKLPAVQVGSSMMPDKINPVIPEFVLQVSFQIRGAVHVIEMAVAAGELDLNVMEPLIARHLLESLEQLTVAARALAGRCLSGLEWDAAAVEAHLRGSRQNAVEHAARLGHDAVRSDERGHSPIDPRAT
jgi:aspartate ammonia-lyase